MSKPACFIAYKVTNTESGKAYIGITTRNLRSRLKEHRNSKRRFGLCAAIRKHGREVFSIEQIASSWSLEALQELERTLIAQHGTLSPRGYNLSGGGDGAWNPSEETRSRISAASRAMSDETKRKISKAGRGQKRSAETCVNIGNIHRGRKRSPETVEKIRAALLRRGPPSQEWRDKIAKAHLGRKLPDWHVEKVAAALRGRKATDEQKAKMSAAQKRRDYSNLSDETRKKLSQASLKGWAAASAAIGQRSLFE